MTQIFLTLVLILSFLASGQKVAALEATPLVVNYTSAQKEGLILASETMDLSKRYPIKLVNDVFKENILLAVKYLENVGSDGIILRPGETFAFHKNILSAFLQEKIITQESGFGQKDGYTAIAGLYGNGVCHLATLMNWVASEAGLQVTALASHDFSPVPGIDRQYGTSIYYAADGSRNSAGQNLYLKNTYNLPVKMTFRLEGDTLRFTVSLEDAI